MDKRLIYRVALKILFSVALIILLIVFVKSLFTVPESQTDRVASEPMPVVTLDLQGIQKGDVRKIRWQGKDVAILKRADDYAFRPTKYIPKIPHPSLNGNARSYTIWVGVHYRACTFICRVSVSVTCIAHIALAAVLVAVTALTIWM